MLYYYYYGISDIWSISSGVRTQTFEQTLKETTMAEILQTYVLLDHAGEYASSALTDKDNEKIDALIDSKKELAENVIGAGGESWITELGNDELMSLLRLDLGGA